MRCIRSEALTVVATASLLISISGVIAMLIPYAAEIYPVHLRGTGSGAIAASSKFGGILGAGLGVLGFFSHFASVGAADRGADGDLRGDAPAQWHRDAGPSAGRHPERAVGLGPHPKNRRLPGKAEGRAFSFPRAAARLSAPRFERIAAPL
ncbi:MAG TPA: hypothetical protein VJ484_00255 [Lysobacter sp.]|nr:hypothetical protein [Lysobacter sp.]